ncbi:unnamed protein product [Candidula unifasciata]|uniref:MD-2-related lipid-recognition domain-containing protein n=1 Tax=Candidula unifasciata TaxID=100452 RepID=A0A8S3YN75_9EUPU|nr:unnamed protein product [Candidula unifasciata]
MAMLKYSVIVLAVMVFTVCRGVLVNVKSCSKNSSDDIIKVRSLNIDPFPMVVPGAISMSMVSDVLKPIDGNLRAEVVVKRKLGPGWITIPCFNDIGSCTHPDVCSYLQNLATKGCPRIFKEMNISCSCPIPAGTYTLPHYSFRVDSSFFGINFPILAGEYQANVRFTDTNTQKVVGCFDMEAKLIDPPSSSIMSRVGDFFSRLFG